MPTERGILFQDRLVRALLRDLNPKTQTRRLVKPPPREGWHPTVERYNPTVINRHGDEEPGPEVFGAADEEQGRVCPYGAPGDRLWVREAWHPVSTGGVHYRADWSGGFTCGCFGVGVGGLPRWRPSIHLRRADARLLLEVTQVRVERLQDISEADARAEGVEPSGNGWLGPARPVKQPVGFARKQPGVVLGPMTEQRLYATAHEAFMHLWDSINGDRPGASWAENPWVWAITFQRVKP
ncbi:MAG: hypothetical protein LC623_05375 [Halobacteriales archaeon]|nr:hypothetical protein [Halobacteriales archaeon]